jgi:hypothetical protein
MDRAKEIYSQIVRLLEDYCGDKKTTTLVLGTSVVLITTTIWYTILK